MPGKCDAYGCAKYAVYGVPGSRPQRCNSHKDPTMVDVKNPVCKSEECRRRPSYNFDGQKAAYCNRHKSPGMLNVVSRRCEEPGCMKQPMSARNDIKFRFCRTHFEAKGLSFDSHCDRRKYVRTTGRSGARALCTSAITGLHPNTNDSSNLGLANQTSSCEEKFRSFDKLGIHSSISSNERADIGRALIPDSSRSFEFNQRNSVSNRSFNIHQSATSSKPTIYDHEDINGTSNNYHSKHYYPTVKKDSQIFPPIHHLGPTASANYNGRNYYLEPKPTFSRSNYGKPLSICEPVPEHQKGFKTITSNMPFMNTSQLNEPVLNSTHYSGKRQRQMYDQPCLYGQKQLSNLIPDIGRIYYEATNTEASLSRAPKLIPSDNHRLDEYSHHTYNQMEYPLHNSYAKSYTSDNLMGTVSRLHVPAAKYAPWNAVENKFRPNSPLPSILPTW